MSLFSTRSSIFSESTAQVSRRVPAASVIGDVVADPEGAALLAQVLARLPGIQRPIVQVVAASARCTTGRVAYALAAEAAAFLGSVLLVCDSDAVAADCTGARQMAARMTQLVGGQLSLVLPDGAVAGLYHTGHETSAGGAPIQAWLGDARSFQMILVDTPSFATSPRSLATAMVCDGCLLTVAAGLTRPADLQAALRQISGTGVRILGTVLHGAPHISAKRWFAAR